MYAFIKGPLQACNSLLAVVEVAGIGYQLLVPPTYPSKLPPLGEQVCLQTVLVVRENSFNLYGFLTNSEKELFEVLIDVSGIGPKTALSVIGILSPQDLRDAVSAGDVLAISKVPGIGKKTAERLIMEIRDKLPAVVSWEGEVDLSNEKDKQVVLDAINALVNLGYHQSVAQKAIKKTLQQHEDVDVELPFLITSALKHV